MSASYFTLALVVLGVGILPISAQVPVMKVDPNAKPLPRMSNGKPDLSGIWLGGPGLFTGRDGRGPGAAPPVPPPYLPSLLPKVQALAKVTGVNYIFGLTTTISPDQRQLLCSSSARGEAPRPSGF